MHKEVVMKPASNECYLFAWYIPLDKQNEPQEKSDDKMLSFNCTVFYVWYILKGEIRLIWLAEYPVIILDTVLQ